MCPKVLKRDVFRFTSIQHLNFPSVTHIEDYAFGLSNLRTLIVENCELIEENAFVDSCEALFCNVKVQCGNLNLDNVEKCTKVEKVVSDKKKLFELM